MKKQYSSSRNRGSVFVWGSTSLQTSLTHSAAYQSALTWDNSGSHASYSHLINQCCSSVQQIQSTNSGIERREEGRAGKSLSSSLLNWHSIWPCLFGHSSDKTKGRDNTPTARGLHIYSFNRNENSRNVVGSTARWCKICKTTQTECKIFVCKSKRESKQFALLSFSQCCQWSTEEPA